MALICKFKHNMGQFDNGIIFVTVTNINHLDTHIKYINHLNILVKKIEYSISTFLSMCI